MRASCAHANQEITMWCMPRLWQSDFRHDLQTNRCRTERAMPALISQTQAVLPYQCVHLRVNELAHSCDHVTAA